jgi:carboxymethylenebutenolidase
VATITIAGARGGDMGIYVATPSRPGPWPGVVVISDALGMTSDLINQADWLAREGFLAAAPDLYYWGGRIRCMFSTMRQGMDRRGELFEDFDSVRRLLVDQESCSGVVGVIGFCMGGAFALLLAASGDYDASSVNYGAVPKDAMTLLANACPIVGSYGAKDPTLRTAPDLLERALTANGVTHDVKVYPEAGHAFLNEPDPEDVPLWALIAGKFSTSGYHEPSARDARQRIVEFFQAHLKPR